MSIGHELNLSLPIQPIATASAWYYPDADLLLYGDFDSLRVSVNPFLFWNCSAVVTHLDGVYHYVYGLISLFRMKFHSLTLKNKTDMKMLVYNNEDDVIVTAKMISM